MKTPPPAQDIWIELPDGRRLAARLWLPAEDRLPAPAILEYLPYRQRDGTSERDDGNYPVFAAAGYAGVRVDMAGNGESDGLMTDEYLEDELAVGQEVIAWIAAQPWCDGAVGMIGISWGGFNGLQIAMRDDVPALRAIVTVCSTHDRYRQETHFIGGCVLNDNFTWGAQMGALSSRPPDPQMRPDWREMWLERMRKLPHFAADWLRHQRHGAYWKHGSVCEDWSAIDCAVLTIGGWADSYSDTPAVLLEHLSAPVKALVGPWEHRYPNIAAISPRADFHGEVIRWFDRWLKGEENGVERLPGYRAYMQEHNLPPARKYSAQRGRWVSEPRMPLSSPPLIFYLAESGLVSEPTVAEVVVTSPQDIGMTTGNYCPGMRVDDELPADQREDDGKSVCFDSAVLTDAVEILGAPLLEVEFSVDQPQAILALRLCDVDAGGSSQRVSYLPFNLAHRESDERPTHLRPGRRYRLSVPMRHCAHRFVAGHRIRLALSTSYWPTVWPSPVKASVTLHLQNCRLRLPLRPPPAAEAAQTAPAEPPAPPTDAPVYDCSRAASNESEVITHADGSREWVIRDDMGEKRNPHHGMEVGATIIQKFFIHPDDPLSARAETIWEYTYRRGDWCARVETRHLMTSDAHSFVLYRKVTAYEGDNQVLEKVWNDVIARDCC